MTEVYLHIGMSKAGSSAIQESVQHNATALAKQGIIYPQQGLVRGSGHYQLVREMRERSDSSAWRRVIEENAEQKAVVFSCEAIWMFTGKDFELLRDAMAGVPVTVILYLRNPWTYMRSSYRQSIKGTGRSYSPREHLGRLDGYLDYPGVIDRFSQVGKMMVAVYEQQRGKIGKHFLQAIGADYSQLQGEEYRVNVTPGDTTLLLMRFANRWLSAPWASKARKVLTRCAPYTPNVCKVDNSELDAFAACEVSQWSTHRLRSYLSDDQIAILRTPPDDVESK